MKNRLGIILVLVAILLVGGYLTESAAQGRVFSHNTKAHKEGKYNKCSACHALPTANWASPRRDKLPSFPDVATFPPHESCFHCHTADVFKRGGGGAFCAGCHLGGTVPSPRRPSVRAFPRRSIPTQFTTLFPHDVHQDLIALNKRDIGIAAAHFIPAAFTVPDEKKVPDFYNCAICHKTPEQLPKYEDRKLSLLKPVGDLIPDPKLDPKLSKDAFDKLGEELKRFYVPTEDGKGYELYPRERFFKNSPDGHASCFSCHYQYKNLPEGKQNCAGCHELSKPYFDKTVTQRYSLKYNHDRVGHVEKDCISCHLRITQSSDARAMKDADVPVVTCMQCHATQEDEPFKRVLIAEVEQRDASIAKGEKPVFQCTYCHTSAIGRFETPASHRK